MSQKTKLPIEILVESFTVGGTNVVKDIQAYADEVAITAIVLSDAFMTELYPKQREGYIKAIDTIKDWANEFVNKFAHVEEWESFVASVNNPYKNCAAWDDIVIAFGKEKLEAI